MKNYNSQQLVEKMCSVGINAVAYKRNPLPGLGFVVSPSQNGSKLYVYADNKTTEIDLKTNKKHKQVVMQVVEPGRVITVKKDLTAYLGISRTMSSTKNCLLAEARNQAPITTGKVTTSIRYSNQNLIDMNNADPNYYYTLRNVEITYKITGSEINILTGIDEKAHFVCAIPEAVNSVDEARRSLRPDNVPANAKRQGEFFFLPIAKDAIGLEDVFKCVSYKPLEKDSSHTAQYRLYVSKKHDLHGKVIVKGLIEDKRKGRHEPLLLTTWHEVIRNNEIVIPFEGRSRYWD